MDNDNVLSVDESKEIFDRVEQYPNYHFYIALLDEKVVGRYALLIMDNLAHHGTPSGIVEDILFDEHYHGRGIGKQMMEFAMPQCRKYGCYKLVLSSNMKRVRAHQFYESIGFKQHGISFHLDITENKK